MSRYALQRGATAGLVFATALLAARLLGPQRYGDVAMFLFLTKMLSISHLGSVSGYVFRAYSSNSDGMQHESGFVSAYTLHMALIALLVLLIAGSLGTVYVLGVLGFVLLVPFYVIEPVLRVKRVFYVSLLPDIVTNLAICVSLAIVWLSGNRFGQESTSFLIIALAAMPFSYLVMARPLLRRHSKTLTVALARPNRASYLSLLRIGLPLYLATIGFVLFQSVDRIFLERFHDRSFLGVYMLAYQLATGATLLLSAQNFVSAIDIGEVVRDRGNERDVFARQLRSAAAVGVPSWIALLALAYFLETHVLTSYDGLMRCAAALGFGLSFFYVANSVTALAYFRRRQTALTVGVVVLVALSCLHNILILWANMDFEWISYSTGLWLSIYGLFAIFYSLRFCQREAPSTQG